MAKPRPAPDKSPETLRAIECLLLWEGAAGNERVRELLGLHFTSASRLLAQYAKLNPIGLSYSTTQRRWLADAAFRPCLTQGAIEEYLATTVATRGTDATCLVRTHMDFGGVTPHAFAVLHRAAREGLGVTAMHASMRNPTPISKLFFPHALVEAGRRWHTRSYVPEAEAFQDFALTRLSQLQLTDLPRPDVGRAEHDVAWMAQVEIRIIPHPDLTSEQKQLVRVEYFNRSAARVETVRGALLPYLIHELRAATDPVTQRPPDYQLCIDHSKKLARWLLARP